MRRIGIVAALLLGPGFWATAARSTDDLTPERRQELEKKAAALNAEGVRYYQAGNYPKAIEFLREALEMFRALHPKAKYPEGHPDLAISINNLGGLYNAAGEYDKAEALLREALDMRRALYPKSKYPDGHPDLAHSINNLGFLHKATGEHGKAEALYREALDMARALYPKAKYPNGHPDLAISINNLGALHQAAGEYGKAKALYREALDMARALYPKARYPNGHPELNISINRLGNLDQAAGEYGKAEALCHEALEMTRARYPKAKYPNGHPDLASNINNLARLHQSTGEYGKAEALYHEGLDMTRALYPKAKFPDGHPDLAASMNDLGTLHQVAGEYGKAEALLREALDMSRDLYPKAKFPDGHPQLASNISSLGFLYDAAGERGNAGPLLREALDMTRSLYPKAKYPNGHTDLAISINNLGGLYNAAGEYGKAEALLREALDMTRALYPKAKYPDGHPQLANSIHNLGGLYNAAGEYLKAEVLVHEALDMLRALYPKVKYPNGHAELVASINNLGSLHLAAGAYGKAEALFREALDMTHALYPVAKYPNGHPYLAISISSLGVLYQAAGEYGKTEALYHEGLDKFRALYLKAKYPDKHPDLARNINNLGNLYRAAGEYAKAEALYREALDMTRALVRRYADLAAEAGAINFAARQPLTRDCFLSATRGRPGAAAAYDDLWDSRALLTRLQEQRHCQLAASRDPNLRDFAEQLRLARLSLSRRLLRPLNDAGANRAEIARLTDAKEELEKRIVAKMKVPPFPKTEMPASRQLAKVLPVGTCFIDLYRYVHFQQGPTVKGRKGEKWTLRYVAFVVRAGVATARVELVDADTIEEAWADWHNAITATRPDDATERKAAAALAHYIWEPLRKELPSDLQTVYLTADGALHQVPWGALPGAKPGTVLLEEHAICLVPHGPFLLNRLQGKSSTEKPASDRLLAVGGIDYQDCATATEAPPIALREAALPGGVRWAMLAGTDKERRQVVALARRTAHLEVTERSGKEATTEQFQRDLPSARYAHVTTHGFFADPKFRSALQIDPNEFGAAGVKDRRGGARSPLSLSGLVFAGANRSGTAAADDRGILTAEGLIGLRMEGLELAVLSACETGLGAYGGDECTYGLQRAFHVAGCRNVVASLWKVDDDATQALMALFYTNLWQKKLDPAEALRQAQSTLYRSPSAVAVAKRRGVDFTESDLPKVENKPEEKARRTPTAQWAAFTFSGVRPVKPD